MMNDAHLHIMLVHFPVIVVPVAAALFAISLWRANLEMRRIAFGLFAVAALVAIPAFLLGEGAEEVVEHIKGVSERAIERHEEAAEVALWLTIVLGLLSASMLFIPKFLERIQGIVLPVIGLLALATSIDLAIVANKGGLIRHTEIAGKVAKDTKQTSPEAAQAVDHD